LVGVVLHGASFVGADLRGANMKGASCVDADFEDATLEKADLEFADLTNARFNNKTLAHAHFPSAVLTGVDLDLAGLSSSDVMDDGVRVIAKVKTIIRPDVCWFVWILDYPSYLAANRVETSGAMRGYEYIVAILIGGVAAYIGWMLQWFNPVGGFWIGFMGILFLYKVLPSYLRTTRIRLDALNEIVRSLSENGV
jgi:hypothetical protein